MLDDLGATLERNIPLLEMIQTLRTELTAALNSAKDQALRFRVEEVELELKLQITKERENQGSLKFWVVAAGAKASSAQQDVHTFKIKLRPKLQGGGGDFGELEVSD
jgi:hypothetical protein